MRVLGPAIAMALWILAATVPAAAAISAAGHATVAATSGRPLLHPEPTYVWHGIRVPVGACAVVVGGHPWVLPCNAKRVVTYRRVRARQRARSRAILVWVAAAAGVGLGAVGGWFVVRRRRHRTGSTERAVTRDA